jgi:hypothetical protein
MKTTTLGTRTYRTTQSSRECEAFGAVRLTYTETVDFDAREVRWSVVGVRESERVNNSGVRKLGPDFAGTPESVTAWRLKSGWHVVP